MARSTAGVRGFVALASLVLGGAAWAGYRTVPVPNAGRVVGRVHVSGHVTPLPPQPVFKEKTYCGERTTDERLVVDASGNLANAVVHLVDIERGKPAPTDAVHLDNRKCAFVPHVVAASVGQTLEIRNADPFLHDAHAILGTRTLFNRAIPKGRTIRQALDAPGIAHVNCNVRHTWMHAYLFIGENPYHVVTAADGGYALEQVPPGTYTIAVWHELLGSSERTVTVGPGETATVDLDLPAGAPETP